jgi:hypothetical protein
MDNFLFETLLCTTNGIIKAADILILSQVLAEADYLLGIYS